MSWLLPSSILRSFLFSSKLYFCEPLLLDELEKELEQLLPNCPYPKANADF